MAYSVTDPATTARNNCDNEEPGHDAGGWSIMLYSRS